MTPRLEIDRLSVVAGERAVAETGGLSVPRGGVLALVGPAGCGKTVLLRSLAGLAPPGLLAHGRARLDGALLPFGDPAAMESWRGRRLALATQRADAALPAHRTLGYLMAESLARPAVADSAAVHRAAAEALERLGVLAVNRRLAQRPDAFGPGTRWRAALALALAAGPAVLLADAPGEGLDPTVRLRLLERLVAWARHAGAALVLTGRAEDGLAAVADRVVTLGVERPVQAAPPRLPPPPPDAGAPVLSVRDLKIAFPLGRTLRGGTRWLTVFDGVGFDIAEGGSLALLGESGSGKSVLARAVVRLIPAVSGRVTWRGRNLLAYDAERMRRLRRDLQVLFPDPRAAMDPLRTVGQQIGDVLENLRPTILKTERTGLATILLEKVGLPRTLAGAWPADLSAAEAVRAGLALALAPEPRLLVCDEPMAALAEPERSRFLDLLLDIRHRDGLTLLYATDNAAEALRVGGRVMVLGAGRVLEAADAAALADKPRHPYSRALLAAASGGPVGADGDPASPGAAPGGCVFRLRCPRVRDFCAQAEPTMETVGEGHTVSCHYWDLDDDREG